MDVSLYVHVPFCTRTCPYCDFYQVPWREPRERAFVAGVLAEARQAREELDLERGEVVTLYWGGGTPSLLSAGAIAELAGGIADLFRLRRDVEFTVEANPAEIGVPTLRALRAAGANRLSLGCQSFRAERLAFLGRWHTPEDAERAVRDAREEGFANLTLDLIFGLPADVDPGGWRRDVERVVELAPEHVSMYGLTIEPRTAFGRRAERGELRPADPDAYADEYLTGCAELGAAGYRQYETSSFARPGRESRHNRRYWTGERYLGLGPAAHSYWDGRRWANARALDAWSRGVDEGRPARDVDETLDAEQIRAERVYLALRSGAPLEPFAGPPPDSLRRFVDELDRAGLARGHGSTWELTPRGHLVLDEIVSRILALPSAIPDGRAPAAEPAPVGRHSSSLTG